MNNNNNNSMIFGRMITKLQCKCDLLLLDLIFPDGQFVKTVEGSTTSPR